MAAVAFGIGALLAWHAAEQLERAFGALGDAMYRRADRLHTRGE